MRIKFIWCSHLIHLSKLQFLSTRIRVIKEGSSFTVNHASYEQFNCRYEFHLIMVVGTNVIVAFVTDRD
jgi:hypothetical protein